MGKVTLVASFFVATPFLFVLSVLFLLLLSYQKTQGTNPSVLSAQTVSYTAIPTNQTISQEEITQTDARVELLRQFFARYHSPLEPFATTIVTAADQYGVDFRLLPAIAMQESTLCKKAPADSYNCWGWGIYGKKVTRFENYTQAIDVISKTIAKQYHGKGLNSPEEIMSKYTPSSNGSWAEGVNIIMNRLQ